MVCNNVVMVKNYGFERVTDDKVEAVLHDGMRHLCFAISLCLEQSRAGRLFLFEHPAQATSWSTQMIRRLAAEPNTEKVLFDFCALGMAAPDNQGKMGPALKRTNVLTNAKHVAATLQKARCRGEHKHVVL